MGDDVAVDKSDVSLEEHARRAADGDSASLEAVCRGVQNLVYRLALRFFSEPADAEDATQEILVKVVTHIGQFDGRSKLTTWVYTIASRHLLRAKQGRVEGTVASAQAFGDWLDAHLQPEPDVVDEVAYAQLCGDVRISCTYGILQCLSREQRITYLLGDLVGLSDTDGAAVLDISRAAYRKRLQRARDTMRGVIANRCGLVSAANPCRCGGIIEASVEHGLLDPERPVWAAHPRIDQGPIPSGVLAEAASQLDTVEQVAAIYRSDPEWLTPPRVLAQLTAAAPALFGAD
jgi:RNA polymerase sigma factor (sigma-70 family)